MSGHPFTFPNNNNSRDSSQDEVIMGSVEPASHEKTLARFRASVATLSQQQHRDSTNTSNTVPQTPIQPPPPIPTTASHPVAASPTPSIVRHHLPSRPLTTPVPIANAPTYPVPIDNFAAPRSDSQQTYVTPMAIMSGHRQQDSLGTIDEKFGMAGNGSTAHVAMYDDDVSLLSNRDNRFTLGDYMDNKERTKTPTGGRQGWDDAGAQGRKKKWVRVLIAIVVVLAIILAVALGVGLTRKNHDNQDGTKVPAAADSGSSSSSPSRVPSSIVPSSTTRPAPSSATESSVQTISSTRTTSASATPRTRSSTSSAEEAAETFSTSFAFEDNGQTTIVPLTYTIPQSRLTRENGWYQFTQNVELPHATGGGSFTSELRFRVKPTGTPERETRRLRRRDAGHRAVRERVIRFADCLRSLGRQPVELEPARLKRNHGSTLYRMNILKSARDKALNLTEYTGDQQSSQTRSLLGRFAERDDGQVETRGRDFELEKLVAGSKPEENEPDFFKEASREALTRQSIQAVTTDVTGSFRLVKSKIQALTDLITSTPSSSLTFTDPVVLRNHVAALSTSLQRGIERFRLLEKIQRDKVQDRVKRQIKIVDPEATEQEIEVALEAGAGIQVFAQAASGRLLSREYVVDQVFRFFVQVAGTRSTEIRKTYTDTLDRHQQMQQLEQTIAELASLFTEVHEMILQQEQQFQTIESRAQEVDDSMEKGVKEVQRAAATAASTRKKRKICAGIAAVVISGARGGAPAAQESPPTRPPATSSPAGTVGNVPNAVPPPALV
ncbi:hypothetical protein OIV83_003789 [Microbotryomycetes sp. JL201]|nr:hypothetical protein OIV83_003789 [Microbotryomycetes sp. JL201]